MIPPTLFTTKTTPVVTKKKEKITQNLSKKKKKTHKRQKEICQRICTLSSVFTSLSAPWETTDLRTSFHVNTHKICNDMDSKAIVCLKYYTKYII